MQTLNSLQSNAAVLQRIRQERGSRGNDNIPAVGRYLDRVGITLKDLDSLSVIHIAGRTCPYKAMHESGFSVKLHLGFHFVLLIGGSHFILLCEGLNSGVTDD